MCIVYGREKWAGNGRCSRQIDPTPVTDPANCHLWGSGYLTARYYRAHCNLHVLDIAVIVLTCYWKSLRYNDKRKNYVSDPVFTATFELNY